MTIYFSLIIYVFERGEFDPVDSVWKRAGEDYESPFSNFFNCIYFSLVTGTTLGYGDMYPKTYVGKVISLLTVLTGLVNLTFTINIIGDCFEEVFRRFLVSRSKILDDERSMFIRNTVAEALAMLDLMKRKPKHQGSLSTAAQSKFSSLDSFFLNEQNLRFKTCNFEEKAM